MKKITYIHREIKSGSKKTIFLWPQLSVSLPPQWGSSQSIFSGRPAIFLGTSLDLLWALWGQLRFWFGIILPCTCFQSSQLPLNSTASNMGTLIVYWDIPQMQSLPRQLQGFTPLLLSLHEQIPFILFGHTAPGAQLCFCPSSVCPTVCRPPSIVCSLSGQKGQKQRLRLIRAHLLTQARGREGNSRHIWEVLVVPVVAEAWGKLHSPREVGSRSWVPWQCQAAQAPWKVWAVTCAWSQLSGNGSAWNTHF